MKHAEFDVIVIGAGHAGCEAAAAASRMGARTALVTMKRADIGVMSCNPAIGGLGKGHLVREIDALDGVMGRVADRAGIQFRLLNRRKGPAVQGPRAQADRQIYQSEMMAELDAVPSLVQIFGEVADFLVIQNAIGGVVLSDGSEVLGRSVVLTTGTFLGGVIHVGDTSYSGGRMGSDASNRLAERVRSVIPNTGRLKTGTPPRLDGKTIDWSRLEEQPGDEDPVFFSFLSSETNAVQVSCGITHTNEQTHDIIRENLQRSAMYGGHIEGIGPRYCPSIEDKIVRFSDKSSHQIFLEPESLSNSTIYPNGISTSLPVDVQERYVRSIDGLEDVEILQPGYAIEYDYADPRALGGDLQCQNLTGLYLAGQINGTTGYEEASAQGLVAGINAVRRVRGEEPVYFHRSDSYIGVMIDDLTTRGVTEPYRMFTSRAEFRLSLRADNADQRLTPLGYDIGCVGESRMKRFQAKLGDLRHWRSVMDSHSATTSRLRDAGISVSEDGKSRSLSDVLAFPDVQVASLTILEPRLSEISPETSAQLKREATYASYIRRQAQDIEMLQKDENILIPEAFDYDGLSNLSNEMKAKLKAHLPRNIAQAGQIDGVTPAALLAILSQLRREGKKRA